MLLKLQESDFCFLLGKPLPSLYPILVAILFTLILILFSSEVTEGMGFYLKL